MFLVIIFKILLLSLVLWSAIHYIIWNNLLAYNLFLLLCVQIISYSLIYICFWYQWLCILIQAIRSFQLFLLIIIDWNLISCKKFFPLHLSHSSFISSFFLSLNLFSSLLIVPPSHHELKVICCKSIYTTIFISQTLLSHINCSLH